MALGNFNTEGGVIVTQVNDSICDFARNSDHSSCGSSTTLPTGIDLFSSTFALSDFFTPGTYTGSEGAVLTVQDIPETSTWAMMALGFAGLGFLGYRKTRNALA
jgi:hypothetical protein